MESAADRLEWKIRVGGQEAAEESSDDYFRDFATITESRDVEVAQYIVSVMSISQ